MKLITGITGQDGILLAEYLLSKGDVVAGSTRNLSFAKKHLGSKLNNKNFKLVQLNPNKKMDVEDFVKLYKPTAIYHLAAFATGSGMYDFPYEMGKVNALSTIHFLEAIKDFSPQTKFVFASSSEIYANTKASPQNENSNCIPRSPYGAAKLFSQNMIDIWREKYGLNLRSAILYNHESELRTEDFVSKKIVCAAVDIYRGRKDKLFLGNLNASRDWGYARDYVKALQLICEADFNENFVVATGKSRQVRELCDAIFSHLNLSYQDYVFQDKKIERVEDKVALVGDPSKIRNKLGWQASTLFNDWIGVMVDAELKKSWSDR